MNYIILNDVNSNTIQGLLIQNLPPITKPQIRTNIEEIDGKDGDIITKLGYSAYDKEFDIGLYGSYDVNEVISYFNSEGTVIFSNEDDKFYKYTIIEQIDFERLIRFKTAKVKMHVQPFKYSNTDTDIEIYATETDAEGTNLTINNTENGASFLDMQLKGQTSQETTTGKNLLNYNAFVKGRINSSTGQIEYASNVTSLIVNNNVITFTVTQAWNSGIASDFIPVEQGNYTYKGTFGAIKGGVYIDLYGSDKTWLSRYGNQTINANETKTWTININNVNAKYIRLHYEIDTAGTTTITNSQLEKGTTATSYEPYTYGPSPNPSYPQNINVVTGNTSVKICNKNMLENPIQSQTLNGITVIRYSDGTLLINGTATANTYFDFSTDFDTTKYAGYKFYGFPDNPGFFIRISKSNRVALQDISSNGTVISNNGTGNYIAIRIAGGSNVNNRLLSPMLIAPTETDTTYIEHQEQNYEINLGTIELCQIGGYQDYIHKNNGNWYIHKEIEKVTWNGTENWTVNPGISTTYVIARPTDLAHSNNNVFYNYFSTVADLSVATQGARIGSSINLKNPNTTDLASFKSWLSTNNTTMYYQSTTPTETQITDENLIAQLDALRNASTYINQTNIITSGDLAPIIYVNVDTIDTNEIEVINSGNIYSKPVVTITGIGTINLYLNDYQVFILELGDTETSITLDVENMEAYNINTGQLMNRQVTGDYNNFIFNSGTNIITWSGTIASVQIVNYSRWI